MITYLKEIIDAGKPMLYLYLINLFLDIFTPFYQVFGWFDSPMHIMGGYAAAWSVYRYMTMYPKFSIKTSSQYVDYFLFASATASIAVVWEVYELITSEIFNVVMQPTVFDTVKDMVLGMVGATIYVYYKKIRLKTYKKITK